MEFTFLNLILFFAFVGKNIFDKTFFALTIWGVHSILRTGKTIYVWVFTLYAFNTTLYNIYTNKQIFH